MANKQGQPTKYKPEYDKLAYNYCLLGATDKDLANYFDVTETTVNNWKIDHPAFFESIKDGRENADMQVAKSLNKRARGYTQKVTKVMQYQGEPIVVDVEEHVPPDTTAAIFWLKNRQAKNWRDKQEFAVSAEIQPDITELDARIKELISGLSDEEKKALGAE